MLAEVFLILLFLCLKVQAMSEREFLKRGLGTERKLENLHVVEAGNRSGPPVLLIHGSPGTWGTWIPLMLDPNLRERYHLLAVDRPGYGGSRRGRAETSLTEQAREISHAMTLRPQAKAIVVGYSFGGAVASRFVMDHPELAQSLILVSACLSPEYERMKWYLRVFESWPLRSFLPSDWRVSLVESFPLPHELRSHEHRWESVTLPISMIQGLSDPTVNPRSPEYASSVIHHAEKLETLLVPGLDHHVPLRRPDLIAQKIVEMSAQ